MVLSSASLNNNLPAKTSMSTSGIPKSREVQEDVSSSHDVQEDVSTSPETSRHVSGYEDHDYMYVSQIPEHLWQEGGVTADNSQGESSHQLLSGCSHRSSEADQLDTNSVALDKTNFLPPSSSREILDVFSNRYFVFRVFIHCDYADLS